MAELQSELEVVWRKAEAKLAALDKGAPENRYVEHGGLVWSRNYRGELCLMTRSGVSLSEASLPEQFLLAQALPTLHALIGAFTDRKADVARATLEALTDFVEGYDG